jgi:hypothetical protein
MGIGMRLYMAPDCDLGAFAGAPKTLQLWLRAHHPGPDVTLHEHWLDLHHILAGPTSTAPVTALMPDGADWVYPAAADRGAHALSSTATETLARALDQVDRSRVEAYIQRRRQGGPPGEPQELTPEQVSAAVEELLPYLGRLRETAALAAQKRYGLLMALWVEEPQPSAVSHQPSAKG